MSSDLSFQRIVKLRVYAAAITSGGSDVIQVAYDQGYTEFSSVQPDGSQGFRIKGKCTQADSVLGIGTNPISLSIYNLGQTSRAIVSSKVGIRIEVFAGYNNSPKLIAVGDIIQVRTHKDNSDYITEIQAAVALNSVTNGEINVNFKGQVSYQQAVDACMDALGATGTLAGTQDIPSGGWQNSLVLAGSPLEELKKICDKMGRKMSVVNNRVYIIPLGQDGGNPIINISPATGLIGIPEYGAPDINGVNDPNDPVNPSCNLSFVHLLRFDLILNQKVNITSRFINGAFVIGRTVFDFDSWSGPFYSRCEAQRVNTNAG